MLRTVSVNDSFNSEMKWFTINTVPLVIGWTVISAATTVLVLKKVLRRLSRGKGIQYKDGVVYLHMFPRQISKGVVNLSPFAVKVETWLRMHKLPYEVWTVGSAAVFSSFRIPCA